MPWYPAVRYGLYHGRPRDLHIHLARTWRLPRYQQRDRRQAQPQAKPEQPWYLATNQPIAAQAVAWYRQRFWIEESFKDSRVALPSQARPDRHSRPSHAPAAGPHHRPLAGWCWLALAALPESSTLPAAWHAAVAAWGRASFLSLALVLLDETRDLPSPWLASIL